MSPTNNTEYHGNWILLQSRYDYIALPVELAVEVMKHMVMVSKEGKKFELAIGEVSALIVTDEQITVARVKAKIVPQDPEPGGK